MVVRPPELFELSPWDALLLIFVIEDAFDSIVELDFKTFVCLETVWIFWAVFNSLEAATDSIELVSEEDIRSPFSSAFFKAIAPAFAFIFSSVFELLFSLLLLEISLDMPVMCFTPVADLDEDFTEEEEDEDEDFEDLLVVVTSVCLDKLVASFEPTVKKAI